MPRKLRSSVSALPLRPTDIDGTIDVAVLVCGYGRFSAEGQLESSVERQEQVIHAIGERNEFPEPLMFVDRAQTGMTCGRDELERCLLLLERRPGSVLIVECVDRLHRSLEAWAEIFLRLKKSRTRLFDQNGEVSDIMALLGALMASEERKRGLARMHAGKRSKAAQGAHQTRTPFGYRRIAVGLIEPDPNTMPLVRELFERRASGASIGSLAVLLTRRGIKPPGRADGWVASTVSRMLQNPIYIGVIRMEFK